MTDMKALGMAVVDALNTRSALSGEAAWRVEGNGGEPASRAVRLTRGDGASIILVRQDYGANAGRVRASGAFPTDASGAYGPPIDERVTVTVDPARPPARIAVDLARRLLPTYLRQHGAACARQAAAKEQHRRAQAAAERLAVAFGPGVRLGEWEGGRVTVSVHRQTAGRWAEAGVDGDGEVSLELHGVPMERAEAIARLFP